MQTTVLEMLSKLKVLLARGQTYVSSVYKSKTGTRLLPHWLLESVTEKKVVQKFVKSRLLVQNDGMIAAASASVHELPPVVQQVNQSLFPFTNVHYSKEDANKLSKYEEQVRVQLFRCGSVKDLFQLLKIPENKVRGQSAATALMQIGQLKDQMDYTDLDSFISIGILMQLYDSVSTDICSLSEKTITSLARCYLASDTFDKQCWLKIYDEIERRIVENEFSIEDMCLLSDVFRAEIKGGQHEHLNSIVENIWTYLKSLFQYADHTNISQIYKSISAQDKEHLIRVEKQLDSHWLYLNTSDVLNILERMVNLRVERCHALGVLGKWVLIHVNSISQEEMCNIVTNYIYLDFFEPYLVQALEKYVPAKGEKALSGLLAITMEYFRRFRYCSPLTFDMAAEHFIKRGDEYSHPHLLLILQPFGQLNYIPKSVNKFFEKAEEILHRKFTDMDLLHILELMLSFMYIKGYPVQFANLISSKSFLQHYDELNDEDSKREVQMLLKMVQYTFRVETNVTVVIPSISILQTPLQRKYPGRNAVWIEHIDRALYDLVGRNFYRTSVNTYSGLPGIHTVDFLIRRILHERLIKEGYKKVGLVIIRPEERCINSRHIIGETATKIRHLELLSIKIVQLPLEEFGKIAKDVEKMAEYLQYKLSPFVDWERKLLLDQKRVIFEGAILKKRNLEVVQKRASGQL